MRQYDLTVMANIGDVLVKEMIHGIDGAPLELVSTPADLDILAVKFVQVTVKYEGFIALDRSISSELFFLEVL